MALDMHCVAAIALRVPVEVLTITKVERHTTHDVPEGARFCPTCGATVEKEVTANAPFVVDEGNEDMSGYDFYRAIRGYEQSPDPNQPAERWLYQLLQTQAAACDPTIGAFVVLRFAQTKSHRSHSGSGRVAMLPAKELLDALQGHEYETFKARMMSLGLWDEDQFGMFAINNANW